jgi:TonB family protein
MNVRPLVLVLCLLPLSFPPVALAASDACPTSPPRIAEPPKLELPADSKISSKEIAFEIDLGSDGRVRALHLDESSGDGAVDMLVQQTLQAAKFDPPQSGCVAYSGGMRIAFGLPSPEPTTPPLPGASVPPTPLPPKPTALPGTKLDATCTPYVHAFLTPVARDRKRTGSATIAVQLDAAGTQIAAPVLQKSTGSPVLDQEALRIARTGQYGFELGSSCMPKAITYELELRFE